ncbi:MAG TPA: BamA/TamA family outer membrane protein [Anaeromyxobacteraceae bacterium]|nr:BamA/TamA family outer membrane protein [Anaeromyxobacteraceae bacterium]
MRPPHSAPRWPVLVAALAAGAAPARGTPQDAAPAVVSAVGVPLEPHRPSLDDSDLLRVFGLRSGPALAPTVGKLMMFILPAFGANPNVGVALGAAATAAVALGPPDKTTISSFSASAMLTTKQQFLGSLKSVALTSENDWELLGDARFYVYSQPTYGLGTGATPVSSGFNINGLDTAALPGAQEMKFDFVKIHETVFRRVTGNAYLGLGYHLDLHWNIVDESLDTSASPPAITSHYAYSVFEGFSPTHYGLSGVSLNALYESRDHTLDPHSGSYLLASWRVNPTWLGSSRTSSILYGEARTYVSLSQERPRHLIAFWAYGQAVTTGAAPYLDLPALGYDNRDRSGRGYPQGRFRGTALVYGEAEYRFPLTRSGLVGGVVFVNATTASRPTIDDPALGVHEKGIALFDSVKPAGGIGVRIMADNQARMNLVMDYAIGAGGSNGFYLTVGETF